MTRSHEQPVRIAAAAGGNRIATRMTRTARALSSCQRASLGESLRWSGTHCQRCGPWRRLQVCGPRDARQ